MCFHMWRNEFFLKKTPFLSSTHPPTHAAATTGSAPRPSSWRDGAARIARHSRALHSQPRQVFARGRPHQLAMVAAFFLSRWLAQLSAAPSGPLRSCFLSWSSLAWWPRNHSARHCMAGWASRSTRPWATPARARGRQSWQRTRRRRSLRSMSGSRPSRPKLPRSNACLSCEM